MRNYAGIEDKFSEYEFASTLLQSIPYDGTSTWGKGADIGFAAFLEASENMEVYDIETDSEVYQTGIHILPEIDENSSPKAVYDIVKRTTEELLKSEKFLTFFGGEHAISIGVIDAFRNKYKDLTILQLDAHADLRRSYMDSEYNHACALHRASQHTNLIQVGIRSMDSSEKEFMNTEKCFFAHEIMNNVDWMEDSLALMTENIYLTIDLDVLDPSIMPATGTPEPGGLDWYTTMEYLRKVFASRNIVGFDIVEFAPIAALSAPAFLVAKMYYKLLSYKFSYEK